MNIITEIKIKGFKKFDDMNVKFNNSLSVLIGENEVGKSTILKAIDIVINQSNFIFKDGSINRFMNKMHIENFFREKTKNSLPKIEIELFIDMGSYSKAIDFDGLHYSDSNEECKTGIRFAYEFDSQFENDVNFLEFANNKVVPTEYYKLTWNTFQGKSYKRAMAPIKMIYLDNSNVKNDLFGSYSRQIYEAKLDEDIRRKLASDFQATLSNFKNDNHEILLIEDNQSIGLDAVKSDIVKLLDIYNGDISIQDMGSGQESLIKTQLALYDKVFDLILIDEPENHLSYTNTRKLIEMIKGISNSQIVIATHSSMIVNRLNLQNIIWLSDKHSNSLMNLSEDTALYFEKNDNLDILRFILATRVILVEGAVEYIIIPVLFESITGKSIDESGIDIISMGSISYDRFKEIADKGAKEKVTAVVTDNDGEEKIFTNTDNFHVFTDEDTDNWTVEVAFYNANKQYFNDLYETKRTDPIYKNMEVSKALAHMLKNKTDNALEIEKAIKNPEFIIPEYLKEAVEWIKR